MLSVLPFHYFLDSGSYLTCRTQFAAIRGVDSNPVPVLSGVPQGSVLGPLLFLFYVNNLSLTSFPLNSSLVLYANDTTLFKPIVAPSDLVDFQSDINSIHGWFCLNHLTASASKTKLMVIFTKRDPFPDVALLNN